MPASAQSPSLQWLRVNDFSPGIRHDINASLTSPINYSPNPQGTAAIAGTYGCEALTGGGLGPLPWNPTLAAAGPAAGVGTSFTGPAITGFHARKSGPILTSAAQSYGGTPLDPYSELFIAFAFYDTSSPKVYTSQVVRLRTWLATPTYDTLDTVTFTTAASQQEAYIATRFDELMLSTPAIMPVVGWINSRLDGGASHDKAFPDPTAPFANGVVDIFTGLGSSNTIAGTLIAHQQRFVGFHLSGYGIGAAGVTLFGNDNVQWTAPTSLVGQAAAAFISDNGSYFAAMGSSNASELILITSGNGAFVVQGDINNPTITKYASVQGTNGCITEACFVPGLGMVYGSQSNGVWSYNGGQSARLLSPNLPGDFFHEVNPVVVGVNKGAQFSGAFMPHYGQFATLGGYLFCPNNWCFNTVTNSWWRIGIAGGTVFCPWWDVTDSGYVMAATQFTGANCIYGATPVTPATQWQWTSHPIPISQNDNKARLVEFMAIIQAGKTGLSNSTYDVTITVYPDAATQTVTNIAVSDDGNTKYSRLNLQAALQGTHVVVSITARGSSGGVAPTLHEFRLGIQSDNLPLKSSN